MCDKELHRGKYVCVHYVPWALDTASATTENPGFFDANVSTENPGLFDTNHPVFHGVCLVVPLLCKSLPGAARGPCRHPRGAPSCPREAVLNPQTHR